MLPRTGTSGPNDTHWPTDSSQISDERYSKPEIQYYYISSNGTVSAIQVFLESILPDNGIISIYTGHKNRIFVHVLGTFGFCFNGHRLQRSCGRFSKI